MKQTIPPTTAQYIATIKPPTVILNCRPTLDHQCSQNRTTSTETTTKGVGGRRGDDRKKAVLQSVKADLQFPVGQINRFLKKGRYAQRLSGASPVYLSAVLEYLATEVLELAGNGGLRLNLK